jgi:hypothetical protein
MKTNVASNTTCGVESFTSSFSPICLSSCRELLGGIESVKESLISEYGPQLNGREVILHSALNEAEALAWQTPFPHLFFPALAEEKALSVGQWASRQEKIWQSASWQKWLAA